jgi:hypothetical protein
MSSHQYVAEVIEKKVVSNEATVGIYNYRFGSDFVRAADLMIKNDLRVNNEFYVAPVYNQLIAEGKRILTKATGREYDGMFGLGVPDDLCFFKTTKHYLSGWSGGEEKVASGSIKIKNLTELYIKFFNQKNIAAIEAILAPEVVLDNPTKGLVKGKNSVANFIKTFHEEQPCLEYSPLTVFVSELHSAIEFQLKLNSGILNGVDLIEWEHDKIISMRVYLKR